MARRPTTAETAAQVLDGSGPLSLEALTTEVVARGGTKAKNPLPAVQQALKYSPHVVVLSGDLYTSTRALLRGRTFTRRLTQEELDTGRLYVQPDLVPFRLTQRTIIESNLGPLMVTPREIAEYRTQPLVGPLGWLDGYAAGDLVAVSRDSNLLQLSPVTDPIPDPFLDRRLQEALRSALELLDGSEEEREPVLQLGSRVHHLLAELPDAFTQAGLPLSERVGDLELFGGLVGLPGTDWSEWDLSRLMDDDALDKGLEKLSEVFGLDEEDTTALSELADACDDDLEPNDLEVQRLVEALSRPMVRTAFTSWVQTTGDCEGVRRVGLAIARACTGETKARALHVAALAEEEHGNAASADELLRDALDELPQDDDLLLTAARYADDRGDAAAAVGYLRAAGVGIDDPQVKRLRTFTEPPATGVSRNAPCPCGSGKKYKACCLRSASYPLADRAPWLLAKLGSWTREPRQRDAMLPVVATLWPEDQSQWIPNLFYDPMTHDLGLWGHELIEDYLEQRGPALPADERKLLGTWVEEMIRLVEVVTTSPGRGLTVRDMDTDEELVVRDREGSRHGKAGQVIACRLLPNGAGEWILSFAIEVPRARRSQLADLLRTSEQRDADFANWYSEAQKPPQMRTKQGYEVVLCSGTWKVSDPHAVMAKLEDAFGHAVDDRINWTDDEGSVLASFSRKGFELEVHTMSHELWEETVDVLIKVAPGAKLLRSDALPAAAMTSGEVVPMSRSEPTTPELEETLRTYIKMRERKWVDESIPALGGLTPRAALNDPKGRRLLIDLLADFDSYPEGPGTMSTARLRELLGLT